jgi:hypothetical protein
MRWFWRIVAIQREAEDADEALDACDDSDFRGSMFFDGAPGRTDVECEFDWNRHERRHRTTERRERVRVMRERRGDGPGEN